MATRRDVDVYRLASAAANCRSRADGRRRAAAPPEKVLAVDEDHRRHRLELGPVALGEGVRLGRGQHHVRAEGRGRLAGSRCGYGSGASRRR